MSGTFVGEGKKAVILISGGLDSTTVLALAQAEGYDVIGLSFDYGQRQSIELAAAREIAGRAGIRRHAIIKIDLRSYGGSALTDDIDVPKGRAADEIETGIPVTYVPARNTIFLSHALALAEVEEANNVFIGVNALDYSGYPDCRPAFIQAFQTMANLATKAGVEGDGDLTIHTPLMDMTKAQIVELGVDLGVNYAHTMSCYDPVLPECDGVAVLSDAKHCGRCDACHLRKRGFEQAGIPDPTPYAV
jgi:7-cyano-7-deazaguanine synthase